jgi:hypothetical protein
VLNSFAISDVLVVVILLVVMVSKSVIVCDAVHLPVKFIQQPPGFAWVIFKFQQIFLIG